MDLVLLVNDPSAYVEDPAWVSTFGSVTAVSRERYGRVTAGRVLYGDGLEVEFGIAPSDWASAPVDPGTADVARRGILVLLDRSGHATALASAVSRPPTAMRPTSRPAAVTPDGDEASAGGSGG